MTEPHPNWRWPNSYGACADFDQEARWPKTRSRARRHGRDGRPRWPTDRQRPGQGNRQGIREIAAAEKINESNIGRVLRLTLLAPALVEAILGGRQPARLQLDDLMTRFPVDWRVQREACGFRR